MRRILLSFCFVFSMASCATTCPPGQMPLSGSGECRERHVVHFIECVDRAHTTGKLTIEQIRKISTRLEAKDTGAVFSGDFSKSQIEEYLDSEKISSIKLEGCIKILNFDIERIRKEPSTAEPQSMGVTRKIGIATLVVSGSTAIGGITTGTVALSKSKRLKRDYCDGDDCFPAAKSDGETVRHLAVTSNVLFGITAVTFISGLVLVLSYSGERKTFAVVPTITSDSMGMSLTKSF